MKEVDNETKNHKDVLVASNLIEQEGRILLVQEGKEAVSGLWDLPSGSVENGEMPFETAEREAKEEVNIAVKAEELIGIYIDESDTSNGRVIDFVYESTTDEEPRVPETDSIMDYKWADYTSIEELELRNRYTVEIVNNYLNPE